MLKRLPLLGGMLLCLTLCVSILPAQAAGLLINGDRTVAGRLNFATATGTATAYAITLDPAITQYKDGQCFLFKANNANSGSATLNVNGLGAKTLQKRVAGVLTNLAANDIGLNQQVYTCYDATNNIMQVQSLGAATGSGTVTNIATSGPITGGPIVSTGTLGFDSKQAGTLGDGGTTDLTCGGGAIGKAQVMDNGEMQYCDGATTSVLRKGPLTQSGLTWNVTAGTCTGDSNGGKLTVNGSNQIICGLDNGGAGGSGDVTDVGTCTTGACFNDATPGARLTYGPIAAPSTPAASKASVYVDSTSKNLTVKNDAGIVNHGVQTRTVTSGQWITGIADDGSTSVAAPTKADVGLGNVDNTSDATKNSAAVDLTNHAVVPRSVTCTPSSNTITPNADTTDVCEFYSLAATTTIANPSSTSPRPYNNQRLEIALKSAAPQTLNFGTAYTADCGLPLPTGTTGDGTTENRFLFKYNSTTTKWCLLATTKAPSSRVTTLTSSTTYTCPADVSESCSMAMTGGAGTLTVAAPTGTPINGQLLILEFLCTSAQTFSWNAIFLASPNIPLPTTCPANTTSPTVVGLRYTTVGSINKWQALATN